MEELIEIVGKFVSIRYRNDYNGFTVARFRLHELNEKDCIVTGCFAALQMDVLVSLKGSYIEHEKYGVQFAAQSMEKVMPKDEDSLVRYFSSALFPGIGRKTAEMIVAELGNDAIQRIKADPDVLIPLFKKKNDKRIQSIINGIDENDEVDDSIVFFNKLGLGVRNIMKLEVVYGADAAAIIKNNPYQMIEDIDGIGFKTADKIAYSLGFEQHHPYRLKALLLSVLLDACMSSGNSFLNYDEFMSAFSKRLRKEGLMLTAEEIDEYVEQLKMDRMIIIEENRIYHSTQYDAEKGIASFLSGFPYVNEIEAITDDLEERLKEVEADFAITYEEKQKAAIRDFFNESFSILTGGPGTGKTTIVRGIIALYRNYYPYNNIALCAPTGRAAKRLSECSDVQATTIHRLLKWDLESNTFLVNAEEPITADLLIIDEFSMVDQWLFYNLLLASKQVKKILVIGDEDQLPSVGPGCVLKDLIASQCFKVCRLEKIFRQSQGSDVVELAHEIRHGCCTVLDSGHDVAFFECRNYQVKDQILKIVNNAFEKGYADTDIQVLAPMYSGVSGIDGLNLALQKLCNPPALYKKEIRLGFRTFREGDKVLQLKNQPDDDVYNGDIGRIAEIVPAEEDFNHQNRIFVDFDGIIVEYTPENFNMLTHAYCVSIHKSQGSEYPIVIMPILNEHHIMLQRRLIYTGVTRAKKSLVLLGEREAFEKAILQQERKIRNTTLELRIREYFG